MYRWSIPLINRVSDCCSVELLRVNKDEGRDVAQVVCYGFEVVIEQSCLDIPHADARFAIQPWG
jgi:hypothetical protein